MVWQGCGDLTDKVGEPSLCQRLLGIGDANVEEDIPRTGLEAGSFSKKEEPRRVAEARRRGG